MTLRLKRNKRQQQQEGERQATTTTITALDKNPVTHIHQPPRLTQRIPLPNNSLFTMGLETNKKWLHGISPDKRPLSILSPLEQLVSSLSPYNPHIFFLFICLVYPSFRDF